jgi:hypothetical protein
VEVLLTEEQLEAMEKWAETGEDEFVPPDYRDGLGASLWPFVEKRIREALGMEEWEFYVYTRTFWRPKVSAEQIVDSIEILKINMSDLPIEVWHPGSPAVQSQDETPDSAESDST